MSFIGVNDIFEELSDENKRLLNELIFADKCLNVLIKFKDFIDLVSNKLKTNLTSIESQNFEQLFEEITYLLNIHKNTRDGQSSNQSSDEELIDEKPILSDVILNSEDTNVTNPSFDTTFDDNSTDLKLITSNDSNSENVDQNNDLVSNEILLKCLDINCGLIFEEPSDLKSHSKTVHSINKAFKCHFDGCVRTYERYKQLVDHINYHNGNKPFACDYGSCKLSFVIKSKLTSHIRAMHLTKGRPFKCQICDSGFRSDGSLRRHSDVHNIDKKYCCDRPDCQFQTHSRDSLRGHISNMHSDKIREPFVCRVDGCGAVYKGKLGLQYHISTYHSNTELKCGLKDCHKVFKTKVLLARHQKYCQVSDKIYSCDWPGCEYTTKRDKLVLIHQKRIHRNNKIETKKHLCPIEGCLHRFEQKLELQYHMNRHNGVRPFICAEEGCGKRYYSKMVLKTHIRHNHKMTEKLFKCEYNSCNKSFKTNCMLSSHKFTHLESKPFHCNVSGCLFRTNNPRSLTSHLKLTHSDERPFPCQFDGCSFRSKTRGCLTQHFKVVHSTDRSMVCNADGCGKTFKNEVLLRSHQRIHENRETLLCDWPGCNFSSKSKDSLKKHKTSHKNERQFMCN